VTRRCRKGKNPLQQYFTSEREMKQLVKISVQKAGIVVAAQALKDVTGNFQNKCITCTKAATGEVRRRVERM